MTLVAATGDIHSPRYLNLLIAAAGSWRGDEPCMVLLAGDLVEKGRAEAFSPAFKLLREKFSGSVFVGVFGNEDWNREAMVKLYPEVVWLDDSVFTGDCSGGTVAVVGSTGALDRLTPWQRRNMPWVLDVFRRRPRVLEGLLREARREADYVVLLTHYGVARATIVGEDPRIHPYLYSSAMERMIARARPDVAVHAHAHNGKPHALVNGVPVYNVSLPLVKRIVEVRLAGRRRLDAFF
ncbi:metallophosphoesterase family protein [Aeropyrum pernix]|nr:metallophosphoesterase [Aeropyrum pernix]